MRKIILAVLALTLAGILNAKPIELNLGFMQFVLPFQETNAVYLYDVIQYKNMVGAETTIARSGNFKGTFGAADVEEKGETFPYISVDYDMGADYFGERFSIGVFYGRDFDMKENRGGIKASILLWREK